MTLSELIASLEALPPRTAVEVIYAPFLTRKGVVFHRDYSGKRAAQNLLNEIRHSGFEPSLKCWEVYENGHRPLKPVGIH